MKFTLLRFLTIILLLGGHKNLFSQQKFEKETRIKEEEAPVQAVRFFHSLHLDEKARWFREESEDGLTYEVKTSASKYSIEFGETGVIQDIEKRLDWRNADPRLLDSIHTSLAKIYKRYKIHRFQRQWTGAPETLISSVQKDQATTGTTTAYELVIKTKIDGHFRMVEILISDTYEIISTQRIITRSLRNLEW